MRGRAPVHGYTSDYRRHMPPEYGVWCGMKGRCHRASSPEFPRYGGRGITVCDRWRHDFPAFLADMGPRPSPKHSIERINNDGNYEPGNCRWATLAEQCRNRRQNLFVEYQGQRMCLLDACRAAGKSYGTITGRMYERGWSAQRAFDAPINPVKSRASRISWAQKVRVA